jgi:hypothetical protein
VQLVLGVVGDCGEAVGGEHQVAAGAQQAAHLLQPAQAQLGREVRPDRDGVDEVERGIGERQGRLVLADEELDAGGQVLAGPGDGGRIGIAAVPADVGVGGGQRANHAPGGAAEVESAAHLRQGGPGTGEGLDDEVGLIQAPRGRERSARHRVHVLGRLRGAEAGLLDRGGHAQPDAVDEDERLAHRRGGGDRVVRLQLWRPLQAALHLGHVRGVQAGEQRVRHGAALGGGLTRRERAQEVARLRPARLGRRVSRGRRGRWRQGQRHLIGRAGLPQRPPRRALDQTTHSRALAQGGHEAGS